MGNALRDGAAWLGRTLRDNAASTVTYSRGDQEVDWLATDGQSAFTRDDPGSGGVLEITVRDFIGQASELAFDGEAVIPERGDKIAVSSAGVTRVYEVDSPDKLSPPWRWSDQGRTRIRIHTKELEPS